MTDLIINLAKGIPFTDNDLKEALYEICETVHSSCNSDCPVYMLNGNKVPDTANDFNINRGCDCFKSGKNMLEFIRKNS